MAIGGGLAYSGSGVKRGSAGAGVGKSAWGGKVEEGFSCPCCQRIFGSKVPLQLESDSWYVQVWFFCDDDCSRAALSTGNVYKDSFIQHSTQKGQHLFQLFQRLSYSGLTFSSLSTSNPIYSFLLTSPSALRSTNPVRNEGIQLEEAILMATFSELQPKNEF